jgi:hypothetical protein
MLIAKRACKVIHLARNSSRSYTALIHPSVVCMSKVNVSPGMAILDRLIDHVTNLSVSTSSSPSSPSPSASRSSYLPSHTVDVAWRPIIPVGHTLYTWVGDEEAPLPSATSNSASVSTSTTAQQTSSPSPLSSSPPPASSSPPPPSESKTRPAAKDKKAAAAPKAKAAQSKAEDTKSDQPDISRLDIRVGQVVKAWKHPEGNEADD